VLKKSLSGEFKCAVIAVVERQFDLDHADPAPELDNGSGMMRLRSRARNHLTLLFVLILLAVFITVTGKGPSFNVQRNSHPSITYEVTVTTDGAPGPLAPGSIHVVYTVVSTVSKPCYPIDYFVGAPISKPQDQEADFPLQATGSHRYQGAIDVDTFQDTVYYDNHPACHWIIDNISTSLTGNGQSFDVEMSD
jgi:hypothetical protein